ncbi:MAG TPA: hypothetical protein VNA16_10265 [Abditibacteriaceae bacterium]|nr:hypothetical protein [Abditibacteriaceae bacterium]
MRKLRLLPLGAVLCVILSGCTGSNAIRPPVNAQVFSFESDLQGWTTKGIDLIVGGSTVDWSIQRSTDRASEGATALKFHLDNRTDAGKIWIERPFAVNPNQRYRVNVQYSLATADFGDVNLWTIITGVRTQPAINRNDLTYQGNTGNGSDTDVGFRWLQKSYNFEVTSGGDGKLYVDIGVWGTWETPRTYYIDNVRVTLTPQ